MSFFVVLGWVAAIIGSIAVIALCSLITYHGFAALRKWAFSANSVSRIFLFWFLIVIAAILWLSIMIWGIGIAIDKTMPLDTANSAIPCHSIKEQE